RRVHAAVIDLVPVAIRGYHIGHDVDRVTVAARIQREHVREQAAGTGARLVGQGVPGGDVPAGDGRVLGGVVVVGVGQRDVGRGLAVSVAAEPGRPARDRHRVDQ